MHDAGDKGGTIELSIFCRHARTRPRARPHAGGEQKEGRAGKEARVGMDKCNASLAPGALRRLAAADWAGRLATCSDWQSQCRTPAVGAVDAAPFGTEM